LTCGCRCSRSWAAALAERFGTSILVAGFAAGVVVAWAGEPERLSGQLLGIAEGFFVPLFFVTLGAQLNFRSLGSSHRDAALAAGLAGCIIACHLLWRSDACRAERAAGVGAAGAAGRGRVAGTGRASDQRRTGPRRSCCRADQPRRLLAWRGAPRPPGRRRNGDYRAARARTLRPP
jgi:hypothetical protein